MVFRRIVCYFGCQEKGSCIGRKEFEYRVIEGNLVMPFRLHSWGVSKEVVDSGKSIERK